MGGWGGGHYHKQSEGLGGVLCHSPSYLTTSRCSRSLRLKELSDWQDLSKVGCSIDISTREGYTCFEYDIVYPWPRQTKVIVPRIGIG